MPSGGKERAAHSPAGAPRGQAPVSCTVRRPRGAGSAPPAAVLLGGKRLRDYHAWSSEMDGCGYCGEPKTLASPCTKSHPTP